MSFPKLLVIFALLLFGTIGAAAWIKNAPAKQQLVGEVATNEVNAPIEVALPEEKSLSKPTTASLPQQKVETVAKLHDVKLGPEPLSADQLPNTDRIEMLFRPSGKQQLSIVETIAYTSRAPWLADRPAWIADYASHYNTSRHFIARSLNRKADYFTQNVSNGDRFNVFKEGKNFYFYMLVDASRCKLWLYYVDKETNERVLLKRYDVGLGRLDAGKASGSLTPLGKYSLGSKVAIYRPTVTGQYQNKKIEMIRVFGTRWVPFEQELGVCTEPAKGFGLHGAPWHEDPSTGRLVEVLDSIGHYESDGCIRLATNDIEEIFSIIISRPTEIEIVQDYNDADLPGVETELST